MKKIFPYFTTNLHQGKCSARSRFILIAILALFFLCLPAGASEPADSTQTTPSELAYRSPFVAGLLSYICPSAGQFYNKEKEKGWEYLGVTWGSLIAGGYALSWAENSADDRNWALGIFAATYLIGIGATSWVAGVVDAGRSAWKKNKGEQLVYPEDYQRKSPLLAGTFSALLPGGGQFYNGDTEKGVRHLMVLGASIYGLIATEAFMNSESPTSFTIGQITMIVSAVAIEVNTIWSVVDAVRSADKRNLHAACPKAAFSVRLKPDLELNKSPLALNTKASPTLSAGFTLSVSF